MSTRVSPTIVFNYHQNYSPPFDGICAIFTGAKEWTLWPVQTSSSPGHGGRDAVDTDTSGEPDEVYRGTTQVGDILFFAPGWWHGTRQVDAEEATLGMSLYFEFTDEQLQPVGFFRTHREALLSSEYYCGCGQVWGLLSVSEHMQQKERCRTIREQGASVLIACVTAPRNLIQAPASPTDAEIAGASMCTRIRILEYHTRAYLHPHNVLVPD